MSSISDWFSGVFSDRQMVEIDLHARIAVLEATNKLLLDQNAILQERLKNLESDDRELRHGLLTRVGLLTPPQKEKGEGGELKPLRKTTIPWATQAAKLEADSKERYWKKIIEDRESLEGRVSQPRGQGFTDGGTTQIPQAPATGPKSEAAQLNEDMEELSR